MASAPQVFQRTMSEVFDELQAVQVYIDGILIWGTLQRDHNEWLRSALQAVHRAGVMANSEKCSFGVQEMVFLGNVLSKKGIRPNASFVEAPILKTLNEKAVQHMVRVMNYLWKIPTAIV